MGHPEPSETQAWLEAAGRVPLLTQEEEILLGRRIQAAAGIDPTTTDRREMRTLRLAARARERFVAANLRLVYRVADQRYRRAVPPHGFVDLLQAGAEGVHHAASKFDPSRGNKFSTYAAWWIRQRIQLELDKTSRTIRPPLTITPKLRKLKRISHQLIAELGRQPTVEELATGVGLSAEEVATALLRARALTSLDLRLAYDSDDTIGAVLQIHEPAADEQLEELRAALAALPRLQRLAVEAAHLPDPPTLSGFARAERLTMRRAQRLLGLGMTRLGQLAPQPVLQLRLPLPDPAVEIGRMPGHRHQRRRTHRGQAEGQLHLPIKLRHGRTLRKEIVAS